MTKLIRAKLQLETVFGLTAIWWRHNASIVDQMIKAILLLRDLGGKCGN